MCEIFVAYIKTGFRSNNTSLLDEGFIPQYAGTIQNQSNITVVRGMLRHLLVFSRHIHDMIYAHVRCERGFPLARSCELKTPSVFVAMLQKLMDFVEEVISKLPSQNYSES